VHTQAFLLGLKSLGVANLDTMRPTLRSSLKDWECGKCTGLKTGRYKGATASSAEKARAEMQLEAAMPAVELQVAAMASALRVAARPELRVSQPEFSSARTW